MVGTASLAAAGSLGVFHCRTQRIQTLASLRHLWSNRAVRLEAQQLLAACSGGPRASATAAAAASVAVGALSVSRTLQPGEAHIWWLDPRKVGARNCCRAIRCYDFPPAPLWIQTK